MKNIKGTDLSIMREDTIILENICFNVDVKQSLKIEGNNGSGKSSLLRALSGLIPFSNGKLFYGNVLQSLDSVNKDYSKNMVYLGHKDFMNDNFTVLYNLQEWASFYNTSTLLMATVFFWNLEQFLYSPLRILSKGWKKKVYFAYLMISNSDIWFLDEPFANLDCNAIDKLIGMINIRKDQGGIVVWTSNDKEEIMKSDLKIKI